MTNPICADVCMVINDKYIGQFKVTAYSLITSNPDLAVKIHLLNTGLVESDKDDLEKFVASLGGSIDFYSIDEGVFEGLPKMPGDASYATYYKLFIPEYIKVDRVLYMDCDIIVRGSIRELFEMPLETPLACVADRKINKKNGDHVQKITGGKEYFNAGVMLFNLGGGGFYPVREELAFTAENVNDLRWHDQDVFNRFYSGAYTRIDEKYNYFTTYKSLGDALSTKDRKKAVIVHYANWKPWNPNYIGKFYRLYKRAYKNCAKLAELHFFKKNNPFSQLKLILKYVFR